MGTKFGNMCLHERNGVSYLTTPALETQGWLHHAFSTRLGGVSTGDCATMNLGFDRGDSREHVLENYRRFCAAAGFSMESLVATAQTHKASVRRVDREDCGAGILRPKPWHDIDSLITNAAGVTLCVYGADCVPLLFADPVNRAIGVAHAGWRGTVAGMAVETVRAMEETFGTRPADLQVVIGPSIGPCCFEVDVPVMEAFAVIPELHSDTVIRDDGNGKYHINLWEANAIRLRKAGVSQITCGNLCTRCHSDLLWSHRATAGRRGAACGMLAIKESGHDSVL